MLPCSFSFFAISLTWAFLLFFQIFFSLIPYLPSDPPPVPSCIYIFPADPRSDTFSYPNHRERERERERMSSAKTARQRGSSATASKENGAKVEEGLSVFKSDKFDADSFVQSRCSLNEKVLFSLNLCLVSQITKSNRNWLFLTMKFCHFPFV